MKLNVGIVFALSIVLGLADVGFAQMNPKQKLAEAITAIDLNYVDRVPEEHLTDAAILGMLKVLDPHCKYYSRLEMEERKTAMSGTYAGIGIQFLIRSDTANVTQVNDGSPAGRAGLKTGDRILAIDGKSVLGGTFSNAAIMKMIRGSAGSPLEIKIYRPEGSEQKSFSMKRAMTSDSPIKLAYMLDKQTAYIAFSIFSQTSRPEMDKALASLKAQGMKNLILDLQGNGGGYVQAALGIADEFLKADKMVYYTVGADGGKDYYYTSGQGNFQQGRLAVLIDNNTASASEIMTGALQDWDRAVIIGRRSFGKGLMQKPYNLSDGSVLELSGARYYTPTERSLQKPYSEYEQDLSNRYKRGEMVDLLKIRHTDTLKKLTLIYKKPVYGGEGITPDLFVPVDTLDSNAGLGKLFSSGAITTMSLNYAELHGNEVKSRYPTFVAYQDGFSVPEDLVANMIANTQEKLFSKNNPASFLKLKNKVSLEAKAQIAAQLYSGSSSYAQVINSGNEVIIAAFELLTNPEEFERVLKGKRPIHNRKKQ